MFRVISVLVGLVLATAPVMAQAPVIGDAQCMTYDCPPYLPAPCVCDYLRDAGYRVYFPIVLK
jgi:hypothetical protein